MEYGLRPARFLDFELRGTLLLARRHPLELVGIPQLQASDVDDLLLVAPEVADAVEDGRQGRLVEPLDAAAFKKLLVSQVSKDCIGLADNLVQAADQLCLRHRRTIREFF